MKIHCLIISVFLLSVIGCQTTVNLDDSINMQEAEKAIEVRLRTYERLLANGLTDSLSQMYTVDAEILHHGSPTTTGRAAIREIFERFVQDNYTSSGFETTGLWGNKDLLVEQGTGYFALANGESRSEGNYLLVWKKVDGEWLIFRDTWFAKEK